jgi:hypothetical protein
MSFPIGLVSVLSLDREYAIDGTSHASFSTQRRRTNGGTRIEPAVSVPKATSAIPLATATPNRNSNLLGSLRGCDGLAGVPKFALKPEGDRWPVRFANDQDIALPRDRGHEASFSAGAPFWPTPRQPSSPRPSCRCCFHDRLNWAVFSAGQ